MKTMGDYNGCDLTNNPWELSSEILKGRNSAEISRGYKNFLENDIDFNEQPHYDFRSKQQDFFGHDLAYEGSEIMLSDRRMLRSSVEFSHMNDNASKYPHFHEHPQGYSDEIPTKLHNTIESTRTGSEEMQRPQIKTFNDDFVSYGASADWSGNNSDYYQAPDFYNEGQKVSKTQTYSREFYDDGIHGMFASDSSISGTPLSNQRLYEAPPRPLLDEPSEEYYSKNKTLNILRSNPKIDSKWTEISSANSIHYERYQPSNHNESPMLSKGNQYYYNSIEHTTAAAVSHNHQIHNHGSNHFQPAKTESIQPSQYHHYNDPNKHRRPINDNSRHLRQSIPIGRLVELNLEEFSTGKHSPYPKFISVPKQLQLLIEEDPEGFMKGLNLPVEVAEHLKASKILNRLKFVSNQKIGLLTSEERKLKLTKYRQKKQNRTERIKAKDLKKKAASDKTKLKGKSAAKKKAKGENSETAIKEGSL